MIVFWKIILLLFQVMKPTLFIEEYIKFTGNKIAEILPMQNNFKYFILYSFSLNFVCVGVGMFNINDVIKFCVVS